MGKRYTFVLNFGYVESAMLSYMPWVSTKTYKDAKEALLDLAAFLKEKYIDNCDVKLNKCCEATRAKDAEAQFCSKCGRKIADVEVDGEEFSNWVCQLNTDTNDFAGFIEWDPDARWQAGMLEGSPNQRFVYEAELVLAAAIGHPQHEDRTFEVICKNRSKSRKNSFNYW